MTRTHPSADRAIVAIGDVHGMAGLLADVLAEADAEGVFPVLLGDLVDKGPDSIGVLRMVAPRLLEGTLGLVRGNHDERLLRGLTSAAAAPTPVRAALEAEPDADALAGLVARALTTAPYWISLPGHLLVHGAFHPKMLACPSQGAGSDVPRKLRALALYGETDGRVNEEGFPLRTYRWVERIPSGLTVVVGHDTRQTHAPLVTMNTQGGRAVFLDTGAAKGGRLSTWRIPADC